MSRWLGYGLGGYGLSQYLGFLAAAYPQVFPGIVPLLIAILVGLGCLGLFRMWYQGQRRRSFTAGGRIYALRDGLPYALAGTGLLLGVSLGVWVAKGG